MGRTPAALASRQLFAKKGEAVPVGITVRDPATKGRNGGPSPLSFLIQRRTTQPEESVAPPRPAPAFAEVAYVGGETVEDYPTAPRLAVVHSAPAPAYRSAAGSSGLPPTTDDHDDWRRISVRLRPDYYRQLKNLARLWGVSLQSLFQKAIAGFLDQACSGDDPNWRH